MKSKPIWVIALLLAATPIRCVEPSAQQPLPPRLVAAYPAHPGFPIYYDEWTDRASVTIADIDHNGSNELLLPTAAGRIHAWSAAGDELPGFPIETGWDMRGRLALGDLDHDGTLEIAAGLESPTLGVGARIAIWRPNGQMYPGWPKDTACARPDQYCSVAAVLLADLDHDANLEVLAATTNRDLTSSNPARYVPNLYVWQAAGEPAPGSWPNEDDHNVAIIGQIAVGDLDGDGYLDIVTGRDYNRLFAFNRLGVNLSGWPHYVWYPLDANNWEDEQIEFPRASPTLVDLDQDGDLEYIIPGHRREVDSATYYATDLLVYTAAATRFPGWELPATGAAFTSSNTTRMLEEPAIGDLTGDGRPEIVLATQDGFVRAYTADKQRLWQYDYAKGQEIQASETVIGDVDGDGWNEVVFGTFWVDLVSKGGVGIHILDHTGKLKAGSPIWLDSVGVANSPALGDLDGDGLIEIATATYDGMLHVWDAPGAARPERLPWPMARHDLQRTGRYADLQPNFSHSSKRFDPSTATFGDTITSVIELVNTGAAPTAELHLTDVVPAGLVYIPGSLHASAGQTSESAAPLLTWTGTTADRTTDQERILISYAMRVVERTPGLITNRAVFTSGAPQPLHLSAQLWVNGMNTYLPIIR